MSNIELILNMLAETSSTEISKSNSEKGYDKVKDSVIEGGNIAKNAKIALEKKTGKSVITGKNQIKTLKKSNG